MGKYCTDCAKQIEEQKKEDNSMESWNFNEVVRCAECRKKLESKSSGDFGGGFDSGFGEMSADKGKEKKGSFGGF